MFKSLTEDCWSSNIVVLSGIRGPGRTVNHLQEGRKGHGFLYLWNGEATFFLLHGKSFKMTGQQLLYLPQGARYKMQYSKAGTTFVLVNFELFNKKGEPLSLADQITMLAKEDPAHSIANIMAKFEACSASQNDAALFRRKELLYRLLSVVYTDLSTSLFQEQRYSSIFKGVLLLKQSYLENRPIEDFAKQSNVSVSTFRRLFKKEYGVSPLQYRNRLRINRAQQLLREGGCTVAEAAYASGFENIGYFCRCYKQLTGERPGQTQQD